MKILLTGARGMVGRNILERAATGTFEMLAPARAELDLCDRDAVRRYLGIHRPDTVIHAAGRVGGIQANMREPVSFLVDNLDMGRNIVIAAREAGVAQLLNLGSSCMYPRGHDGALTEDMVLSGALEPTNEGYAIAKIATAKLCEYVTRENPALQYKTLIPCNLYGRHDSFDPVRSHLIPAILHKMHVALTRGEKSVEIWGDGNARREFMYAGDLADAIIRSLEDFSAIPPTMNVGLGFDYTINEYYQAAAEVVGYPGNFHHDLGRPVGMARKLVDVRLQTEWGWEPRHTLREGMARTYAYYLESISA